MNYLAAKRHKRHKIDLLFFVPPAPFRGNVSYACLARERLAWWQSLQRTERPTFGWNGTVSCLPQLSQTISNRAGASSRTADFFERHLGHRCGGIMFL